MKTNDIMKLGKWMITSVLILVACTAAMVLDIDGSSWTLPLCCLWGSSIRIGTGFPKFVKHLSHWEEGMQWLHYHRFTDGSLSWKIFVLVDHLGCPSDESFRLISRYFGKHYQPDYVHLIMHMIQKESLRHIQETSHWNLNESRTCRTDACES